MLKKPASERRRRQIWTGDYWRRPFSWASPTLRRCRLKTQNSLRIRRFRGSVFTSLRLCAHFISAFLKCVFDNKAGQSGVRRILIWLEENKWREIGEKPNFGEAAPSFAGTCTYQAVAIQKNRTPLSSPAPPKTATFIQYPSASSVRVLRKFRG